MGAMGAYRIENGTRYDLQQLGPGVGITMSF